MDKPRNSTPPEPPIFSGTLRELIDWLDQSLVYGGTRVTGPLDNGFGREVMRLETFTGGFSEDEELLGRLGRNIYLRMFWQSSHRGGQVVYEFPLRVWDSPDRRMWLDDPESYSQPH